MNILILGNGFDLAHGLPTRYTNFLEWVTAIKWLMKSEHLSEDDFWRGIKEKIDNTELMSYLYEIWKSIYFIGPKTNITEEICTLISNNVLIEYFLICDNYVSDNWIDFELELSKIIQVLDILQTENVNEKVRITKGQKKVIDNILRLTGGKRNYLRQALNIASELLIKSTGINVSGNNDIAMEHEPKIDVGEISSRLEKDLDSVIRLLEIYLSDFVKNIKCQKKSEEMDLLKIDKVLSFNYTSYYESNYDIQGKALYDYVHGKANINNTIDTNNMVLGIDEYLSEDRRDKDVEFIAFKKYYQRIFKQTGCEYKTWIEEIKADDWQDHCLYIFGHSLDITDRDVLKEFILNDNVFTTIYYHNKKELGKKIANLVKIIGQDELIRRTGGRRKTIKFVLQNEMMEV